MPAALTAVVQPTSPMAMSNAPQGALAPVGASGFYTMTPYDGAALMDPCWYVTMLSVR